MAWNKISQDEQEWTEEQYRKAKIDLPAKVVDAIDDALTWCIGHLGVDTTYPHTFPMQQEVLGIAVQSCDEDVMPNSPRAWGFYVIQNFEPKYFVRNPYFKHKDIHITVYTLPDEKEAKDIIVARV